MTYQCVGGMRLEGDLAEAQAEFEDATCDAASGAVEVQEWPKCVQS